MIKDEKNILRLIDWGIYLVFIPIIIVLIPTDKLIEYDPNFMILMMLYMVVIHTINRRYNFVTALFQGRVQKAVFIMILLAAITYLASEIRISDKRGDNALLTPEQVSVIRNRVLCTLCFIDLSFAIMLGLVMEIFRQKMDRRDVEVEKNKAELAVYKSQINPHFMFNTLNTIYALNLTQSPNTSEVIMKFSSIVKYMYQNSDKEKIMIVEEVKYLKEYIDLHTLRMSDQTKVNFLSDMDDHSQRVPSMIFITFVENVFKYGVSSSEDSTIEIVLRLKSRELLFTTVNTVFSRSGESAAGDGGIGIENCRKRLQLLYPNRYTLECGEEGGEYKTVLKIQL